MSSNVSAPASPAPPALAPTPAPAAATAATGVAPAGPAIAVSGTAALAVTPGQVLAARVVAVQGGMIELALAGGLVTAASDLPMEPGQTLRLVVDDAAAERVTLRIAPPGTAATDAGAGGGGLPIGPGAALADEGVPSSAATALLAALSEEGADLPTGGAATALAARASAAGVSTPAQAAAFVRLMSAGLPTTPAAVAGLAQLIEGAPLGRALATIIDAATARAATPPAPGLPGQAPGTTPLPGTPTTSGTSPAAAAAADPDAPAGTATTPARTAVPTPPTTSLAPMAGGQEPAPAGPGSNWTNARGPIGPSPTTPGPQGTAATASTPLGSVVETLSALAREIESGAVEGRGPALRHALAELGVGLEGRLASGSAPDHAPLRSVLLALAEHPGADPSLGRAAASLADALGAQGLVAPALAPAAQSAGAQAQGNPNGDPSAQNGAYLQVPLPGGGTAEVRVSPDAGRDGAEGGEKPRRLAFLLHLSALGPVMIDASAGAKGVDATIRVGSEEARAFLDTQAPELAEALRRSAPAASVRVEKLATPAPERLLAPPPSSGLDIVA